MIKHVKFYLSFFLVTPHYGHHSVRILLHFLALCPVSTLIFAAFLIPCAHAVPSPQFHSHDPKPLHQVCTHAARAAEKKYKIPQLLLVAIGMTESGKWHNDLKKNFPWPWTVRSGEHGAHFLAREDAIAHVKGLKNQHITNIDIGCFQINLFYHPQAFHSWEDGFTPKTNAEYAARLLLKLKNKNGSWSRAVAFYHSSTSSIATPYRKRVYTDWQKLKRENSALLKLIQQEKRRLTSLVNTYKRVQKHRLKLLKTSGS